MYRKNHFSAWIGTSLALVSASRERYCHLMMAPITYSQESLEDQSERRLQWQHRLAALLSKKVFEPDQ